MQSGHASDATLATLLTCMPAFQRWANQPLDPKLKKLLNEADEQVLLSIAVHALQRAATIDAETTALG